MPPRNDFRIKTFGPIYQNKVNGQQWQKGFETTENTEGTEKRRIIMAKFLCALCVLCSETSFFNALYLVDKPEDFKSIEIEERSQCRTGVTDLQCPIQETIN